MIILSVQGLIDGGQSSVSGMQSSVLSGAQTAQTPVIIISAMGQVDERIRGLRMGADDYICKPFQIGELLARVETVLRRTQRMAERLEIEDVAIDPKSRTVTKAGEQVELTVRNLICCMSL